MVKMGNEMDGMEALVTMAIINNSSGKSCNEIGYVLCSKKKMERKYCILIH